MLDALRHVAGEVKDFDAEVRQDARLSTRWYAVSLRFESGACGRIEVLPTAGVVEETYEFVGGRIRMVAFPLESRGWRVTNPPSRSARQP